MSKTELTEKQNAVFAYLRKSLSNSFSPTVREICDATGIRSTSTVHAALAALEENGYITRSTNSSRSVRLTGMSDASMVPIVGKVTAGNPILAVEEIEGYIPCPTSPERSEGIFALRVSGLSMRDAGILDGDIIFADRNIEGRDGDIVVALIEDEATVKRLVKKHGEKPYLLPENPDFDPIYPEYMTVLGCVVGSYRKYR